MAIESAKVTFSKIGVTTSSSPRTVIYIPRISIKIEGRKSAKTGYLAGKDKSGLFRFKKESYKGIGICKEMVVIITDTEYITIGEDAIEHGSIPILEAGVIVATQEEGFVCLKDETFSVYDINCSILFSKKATKEELAKFYK